MTSRPPGGPEESRIEPVDIAEFSRLASAPPPWHHDPMAAPEAERAPGTEEASPPDDEAPPRAEEPPREEETPGLDDDAPPRAEEPPPAEETLGLDDEAPPRAAEMVPLPPAPSHAPQLGLPPVPAMQSPAGRVLAPAFPPVPEAPSEPAERPRFEPPPSAPVPPHPPQPRAPGPHPGFGAGPTTRSLPDAPAAPAARAEAPAAPAARVEAPAAPAPPVEARAAPTPRAEAPAAPAFEPALGVSPAAAGVVGPVGRRRSPAVVVVLSFLTLGLNRIAWHSRVNREMSDFHFGLDVHPARSALAVAIPWLITAAVTVAGAGRLLVATAHLSLPVDPVIPTDIAYLLLPAVLLASTLEVLLPVSLVADVMTLERLRLVEAHSGLPTDEQIHPSRAVWILLVPLIGGAILLALAQSRLNAGWLRAGSQAAAHWGPEHGA